MNCKLEKFWNRFTLALTSVKNTMNCKLEKFWNSLNFGDNVFRKKMNCKLEKFWNDDFIIFLDSGRRWTVNLKSFEI